MRLDGLFRAAIAGVLVALLTATLLPAGTASAAGGTIKIGVDFPLSGADDADGGPAANGVILAVEQANKRGLPGGYKLETSVLDDAVQGKHDPAAGAQNVKTFIADSAVLSMIGPFNSNVATSEIPLTNDAGLVQISPSNTNDGLTVGDNAKKLREAHPDVNTYFRVCTRDSRQGAALATFSKKLGYKKMFVIDDNETYGKGLADSFAAAFAADGGTVLGHEHITANQQDFKSLLTKVKSTGPDAVFYGGTTSTGGALVRRQMGDVGMTSVPYVGGDGISDGDVFVTGAGPTMAKNVYFSIAAPDAAKLPSAKPFVAAYKARFTGPLGAYSANSYSAAMIEIAAIEKAIKDDGGSMPTRAEVLKNVASTHDFETPIGKIGFDANGDTTAPLLTLQTYGPGGTIVTIDQIVLK